VKFKINIVVARVRRRGESIQSQNGVNVANVGRQGILVFYQLNGMRVAT